MELRHKASGKRALKQWMAMWQLGMWSSLLIILLSNSKTSAELRKINYDPHKPLNVSKGLYDCTMEKRLPLLPQRAWSALELSDIQLQACLCCRESTQCEPCLQVQLKLRVTDEEDLSGDDDDDDDDNDESAASLNLCYSILESFPSCYEVRCALQAQQQPPSQLEVDVVLKSEAIVPGITVYVTAKAARKRPPVNATITIPLKDTICAGSRRSDVKCCASQGPPRVSVQVYWVKREVRISAENATAQVDMCLKRGKLGTCRSLSQSAGNIPLDSLTPCTCIQAWWKESKEERSERCLNNKSGPALEGLGKVLHQNVWKNLTTSVRLSQTHSGQLALRWNLSAPCRVPVEDVHLCLMGAALLCQRMEGIPAHLQELESESWMISGAFVNISSDQPICLKMKAMGNDIGPFCPSFPRRGYWIVPLVAVLLLFMLMVLGLCSQRDTVEKWIQKWHSTSLLQAGRGHVLLLHPPCEDPSLTEMVCLLGSTLKSLGFSVSLDLWSHVELGSLGPVPWLHSQLEQVEGTGGRALLVLSHAALERAEEWSGQDGSSVDGGPPAPPSLSSPPPTDVFTAALRCLLMDLQGTKEAQRHCFSLVHFDSHSPFAPGEGARHLPGLFQGMDAYSLPKESRRFLDALVRHGGGTRRSWRWKSRWQSSWLSRALMKRQLSAGEHLSQSLEKSSETVPLQP